jgi:hypothetical protein
MQALRKRYPALLVAAQHVDAVRAHGSRPVAQRFDGDFGVRLPWRVPADWARTVFLGLTPIVPHYLLAERARGLRVRYDIRLRGDRTARAVFTIDDGVLTVGRSAPGTRADCYLLVLYSRTGPSTPALAGRIVAWGRRTWLALKLPSLFRKP